MRELGRSVDYGEGVVAFAARRSLQFVGASPMKSALDRSCVVAVIGSWLGGHDLCHGGDITTLADSAFAYAWNSYDELTVASGLTIDFLAPARPGEMLTASAHEVSKAGRTVVCDVEVSNQNGGRIAVFRRRSHTFRGRPAEPQADA